MYKLCFLLVAIFMFIAVIMTTLNGGYWLGCTLTIGTCLEHPIATVAAITFLAFLVYLL